VECDEAYITAGHKGQPAKVIAAQRKSRCRKLKGSRGRGTLATERPPIFGMIQRNGEVRIQMLANVQQETIRPIICSTIAPGTSYFY
jgi:transposase-like protein